jgi:hypothetical protein
MKLLAELRSLKKQVIALQENQKEKETKGTFTCSGSPVTEIDPITKIGMMEMEIETLYLKLIDAQSKAMQHESDY